MKIIPCCGSIGSGVAGGVVESSTVLWSFLFVVGFHWDLVVDVYASDSALLKWQYLYEKAVPQKVYGFQNEIFAQSGSFDNYELQILAEKKISRALTRMKKIMPKYGCTLHWHYNFACYVTKWPICLL